eukprot:8656688-Lingulodinium_polyedra.AAC.1
MGTTPWRPKKKTNGPPSYPLHWGPPNLRPMLCHLLRVRPNGKPRRAPSRCATGPGTARPSANAPRA